jgi:hypothetical protein
MTTERDLPVGTRTRLVDAVLDLSAAEPGTHLQSDPPRRRRRNPSPAGNAATTRGPDPPEPAASPQQLSDKSDRPIDP